MNNIRKIIAEFISFIFFLIVYGFCVGMLVYLALTNGADINKSESIRYAIYSGLIIAPIVYTGVQVVEGKENRINQKQEKLKEEIRKFLESR